MPTRHGKFLLLLSYQAKIFFDKVEFKCITKIIIKDSIFNLKPDYGLSYNFKIQKSASSISNIHRFKMNFIGREIKTEYPLLYKAIKSNNLDSINTKKKSPGIIEIDKTKKEKKKPPTRALNDPRNKNE